MYAFLVPNGDSPNTSAISLPSDGAIDTEPLYAIEEPLIVNNVSVPLPSVNTNDAVANPVSNEPDFVACNVAIICELPLA